MRHTLERLFPFPIPRFALAGVVVMGLGLAADLVEHTLISHEGDMVVAGFPLGEHAVHLLVLVGMVLLLGSVVADGARRSQRRVPRPERSSSHAIR